MKRASEFHPFWPSKLAVPLGLIFLACLGVWLPLPYALRLAAVTLLTTFLPGYFLLQAIRLHAKDPLEQVILSIGSSYGLTLVGTLIGLYIAGYLSAPLIVGGLALISLALVTTGLFSPRLTPYPLSLSSLLYLCVPVVVAAFFSFTGLGYSDYWGDEMNGLLRALSIIAGQPDILFEHTKGAARHINNVCRAALLLGATEHKKILDETDLKRVILDLDRQLS